MHYGDDFFLEQIEEEYGISPESNDKLLSYISDQFSTFDEETKRRLKTLETQYQTQINQLRKDLLFKTQEISQLQRQGHLIAARARF